MKKKYQQVFNTRLKSYLLGLFKLARVDFEGVRNCIRRNDLAIATFTIYQYSLGHCRGQPLESLKVININRLGGWTTWALVYLWNPPLMCFVVLRECSVLLVLG